MPSKRSLSELYAARLRAVELREQGKNISEISRLTGLSRPTVSAVFQRYAQGGDSALRPAPRGRSLGEGRLLSPARELHLKRLLFNHSPQELEIDAQAWTRKAVLALINREFRHARIGPQPAMTARTLGHYLHRWGLTGHVVATHDIGPGTAVGLGQARLLWELLCWYPRATRHVNALAAALAASGFIGRHLFGGLYWPWTLRRRLNALMAHFKRFSKATSLLPPHEQPSWLISSEITYGWQQFVQVGADLDSSPRRQRLTDRATTVNGATVDKHVSIRFFPTKVVEISHGRSATRHVGITTVQPNARQALFMGCVDLLSGDAAVELVMDPTGPDEARDNVHAKLLSWVADAVGASGNVQIHLPIGFLTDLRYYQVALWAAGQGLKVREDMPPAFFADALPVIEHFRLELKAGRRVGSLGLSAQVPAADWLALLRQHKKRSGPIPGETEGSIAGANRKPRRAEGKKDKA